MYDIKPITLLTDSKKAIISVYSSVYGGLEIVYCTNEDDYVLIEHDCPICKRRGHLFCPYVDNALKIVAFVNGKFPLYKVKQTKVILKEDWTQHPVLSLKNKKKEAAKVGEKVNKATV